MSNRIRCAYYLLYEKYLNNKNIVSNMGWLVTDKIIRMCVGLFIGIWVARYLGPSQYGLLNYCQAIITILLIISSLGLDGLVIRKIVQKEYPKYTILGTAFYLRLFSSFSLALITILLFYYIEFEDKVSVLIISILSIGVIIQSFDVIDFWFQSQVQSKYIAWSRNIACLISAALKAICIIYQLSIIYFAVIIVFELFISLLIYLYVYRHNDQDIFMWRFSVKCAKDFFSESLCLLLNAFIVILIFKTDQIMLKLIVDDTAVGIYTVATRITEIFYFIPMIISASCLPKLLEIKKQSVSYYQIKFQQIFAVYSVLSIFIAILITLLAPFGIRILYGEEYYNSIYVLYLYVWTALFVFSGHLRGHWLLNEKKSHYNLYVNIAGFISNVLLNYILIPHYSYYGAAVATVISNFLSHYFLGLFFKNMRDVFIMQTKGFVFWGLLKNKAKEL